MRISLFGPGLNAKSPAVTAKRLLNMFCESRPQGEKAAFVAHGIPGDVLFVSHGDTPVRGSIVKDDLKYEVHRGTLYEVNNAGVRTSRGTLNTTSGRVSMACNGPEIAIADGTDGYIYTIATTTLAEITDVDFFANPETVAFLDGYFIWSFRDSGRYQISGLYGGANYDALAYGNAEGSPDNLLHVLDDHSELVLFGGKTVEFAQNQGTEFPFQTQSGSRKEVGLAARWSVAQHNDGVAFLGRSKEGGVRVYVIAGHVLREISNPDLWTIINGYDSVSDATAMAINIGGHPCYILNFASADATWMYVATTGFWHPLSTNGGRWFGEIATDFVNKLRVTDYATGNVYTLDEILFTHNGQSIERELIGETIMSPEGEPFFVDCVRLIVETGVGLVDGQGEDPQIMLQVSRDDGKTYGSEMWTSLGRIGTRVVVEWTGLGLMNSFTPKFRVTDPVKVTIVAGILNP